MSFLCLFGKGTKISKYLINHDKEYIADIKLGIKTSTADREGEIIEQKEVNKDNLEEEKINEVLKSFIRKTNPKTTNIFCNKVKSEKNYMNMQEKARK